LGAEAKNDGGGKCGENHWCCSLVRSAQGIGFTGANMSNFSLKVHL
jgi:hypothetical protein